MFVLQQSSLQRRYLMRHDIDADRIHKITPPINVSKLHRSDLATTHPEIAAFVRAPPALLLFTAVARLDFFKNVELLVDAGIELLRRGFEVKVLVAGGDDQEQYRRVEIRERIPVEVISSFMVVPKLPKDGLRALFDLVGDSGFFICPSRYETLGITPLEAALSCVPTLITDSTNVEASIYFPAECRFCPSIMKLADLVERFQMQGMSGRGQALRDCLQEQISPKNFKDSLLSAWAAVSRSNQTSQIGCTDDIKHIHGRETGTVQQALCFKVGELELDEGEARLRMADLA